MPVESAADRATFLSADEFGASGVYVPAGSAASAPFPGIFDDPSIAAEFNEVATIDSRPTFCCDASNLPAGADTQDGTDVLIVAGVTFVVVSIEPDGTGMARLALGALAPDWLLDEVGAPIFDESNLTITDS